MAVQIKINGTDKSSLIDWQSCKKTEVLTKEPDTLEFLIKNYPTKTYLPALGDTVNMFDGANLIFAGIVVEIDNTVDGLLAYNKIICKDYTHLADQKLVTGTYTNKTAAYILNDIVTNYCPAGFTANNVVAPTVVDSIVFNYVTVTAAIQKLISACGGAYDYYFDYVKDLHFFPNDYIIAPFSITDTSQNFDWQSLKVNTDLSQLRNKITVRGGLIAGTSVTNNQLADGKQRVFFVGYALTGITIAKALAASPTSFVTKTVGADGKDDPTAFDCLYNPDSGLVIFPDSTKPAINDVIQYTGVPSFSVIVQLQNPSSITQYGAYEYLIVDKTIITKATARNRAVTELLKYSQPLVTGSFNTRTSGLKAGQTITINSAKRGINDSYKIQRITTQLRTPSANTSDFMFSVEVVSTQTLTMNDVLKKLLVTDQTDQLTIGSNEIVDIVYTFDEVSTTVETFAISGHIQFVETSTTAESFTLQAPNYPTDFVLGDFDTTQGELFGVNDGSLIAQYKLNENSGATVIDSTGISGNGTFAINSTGYYPFDGNANDGSTSANNGSVVGSANLTTDRFGNVNSAYDFSANGMYVNLGTGSPFQVTGKIFISAWVYIYDNTIDSQGIVTKDDGNSNRCFNLSYSSAQNGFQFRVWDSGGTVHSVVSSSKPNNNTWYHIVVTADGTNLNMWVNGASAATPVAYGGTIKNVTSIPCLIGKYDSYNSFSGKIDEVLIGANPAISTTPTSADILQLYKLTQLHDLNKPWVTGKYNGAYDMWGYQSNSNTSSMSYIDCGFGVNNKIYGVASPWTVSYWTYVRSGSGGYYGGRQIGWYGGNYKGMYMGIDCAGNFNGNIGQGNTTGVNSNYGINIASVCALNTWNLVTVTYDGTNVIVYINGVNVGQYNLGAYVDNGAQGTQKFCINKDPWDFYVGSDGIYDDIRVYNRGLTALEVTQLVTTNKRQFVLDGSRLG